VRLDRRDGRVRSRLDSRTYLLIAVFLVACGKADAPKAPDGPQVVYVVNYPLKYFAERVAGGAVQAVFPAPGDIDPALWKPDGDTISAYQNADRILLNGAGYAGWTKTASLPASKMVVTYLGRKITVDGGLAHSHGPGKEHAHGDIAFTTWIDPKIAVEQARAVAKAVPGDGLPGLEADLVALDKEIESAVSKNRARPVVFSHPVYQYLERRYRLNGRSVHWEPDDVPDDAMWKEFEKLLAKHPARWMIWEGEPSAETVKRLEALGVKSVVFDPCGNTPESGDYLSVMRRNVEQLALAYR
jgi:zinc transport system substrate-binding protein